MKVTFAHMGNLWITVKTILEDLGLEVVVPPRPSRHSLDIGVRHSPEFACFPLKMNIGDYVGAIEKGADTIVMVGGIGPCRLGHYAQVQMEILKDLGYQAEMVILEPPRGHFSALLDKIRYLTGNKPLSRVVRALRFGWEKLYSLDCLDRALVKTRPLEPVPGTAGSAHRRAVAAVAEAGGIEATRRATEAGVAAILAAGETAGGGSGQPAAGLPAGTRTPLRVGIVGEVFMVAEPFANLDLERRLGEMGVEVTRALYVSDWVRANLFLDTLRLKRRSRQTIVKQAASPYLGHFVGGEGLESVGESVIYSRQGYDGVIHVAPFTCMPEIVATSLLPEVGRDLGLPNMSLFLDEHTGDAGLATRLEAFVDLLARRRARLKTGAEVAAPRPLRKPSTGHTCWKSLAGGRRGSEGKPCVPWDRRGLGDDQGYRGR